MGQWVGLQECVIWVRGWGCKSDLTEWVYDGSVGGAAGVCDMGQWVGLQECMMDQRVGLQE